MKGSNEITVCTTEALRAFQDWADKRFTEKVKVEKVEQIKEQYGSAVLFKVTVSEPPPAQCAPPGTGGTIP